jgi:curved DNA-binding protein CbpA
MKNKYSKKEILKAKEILRLPSFVTKKQIEKRYRELVKKYHPDINMANKTENEKKIKEINNAYKIIMNFIENYEYSFSDNAINRYTPDEGNSFINFDDPIIGK